MCMRDHIIIGGAASAVLYVFTGPAALWFFSASVLIDLDHYLDFVFHNRARDLSIKRMFDYHSTLQRWWRDPAFLNMEIFHTAEFLIIFLSLAIILQSRIMALVFGGFIFHIILDMIFLLRHNIFNKRTNSLTSYFIRKNRMARMGHDPAVLYSRAVEIVSPHRHSKRSTHILEDKR
ncbi:MAG: hypothetical protein ACE5EZ_00855 [Thermodesulfobacteriota bacterium]